jgi:hypothetical protein
MSKESFIGAVIIRSKSALCFKARMYVSLNTCCDVDIYKRSKPSGATTAYKASLRPFVMAVTKKGLL